MIKLGREKAVRVSEVSKRRWPVVVDGAGLLSGIVTSMDVMRALARSEPDDQIPVEYVALSGV